MRRGLLKDLANTPTQMACGWQLYGDVERLAALAGETVAIDLFDGSCAVNGAPLEPPLFIADTIGDWLRDRHQQDAIPDGLVHTATLEARPRIERHKLLIAVSTVIESEQGTFTSSDEVRW